MSYRSLPPPTGEPYYGMKSPSRASALFLFGFFFVQGAFLVILVAAVRAAVDTANRCESVLGDCTAAGVTTGVFGVGVILFLWVMVDIIIGIGWYITKHRDN